MWIIRYLSVPTAKVSTENQSVRKSFEKACPLVLLHGMRLQFLKSS